MKKQKKQAAQKKGDDDEEEDSDQDPLFANPNTAVGKKMNISDLSAPRQLSRRERHVLINCATLSLIELERP